MTQRGTKVNTGGNSRMAANQPSGGNGRLTASQPDEIVVVLVGDARVGKTCLATRFCEHIFIQVCHFFLYHMDHIFFNLARFCEILEFNSIYSSLSVINGLYLALTNK